MHLNTNRNTFHFGKLKYKYFKVFKYWQIQILVFEGVVERDQISDIRPPKKSNIRSPKKSNIRYHAFAKIRYLALKNQISDPKKINYQISHPLKNQISRYPRSPPPPPPSSPFKTARPLHRCRLKTQQPSEVFCCVLKGELGV